MGTLISILKRFINSDLTKPINTMIDEVKATLALIKAKTDTITANLFTSTHASRIDASISSRASQASVDAIKSGIPIFGKVRPFSYAYYNNMPLTTIFSYSGGAGKVLFIKNVKASGALDFIIDGNPVPPPPLPSFGYGVYTTYSDGYDINFEFKQSVQIQRSITENMSGTIYGIVITEN